MCRSIQPLFNLEPPASQDEIRAAARQFVRKVAGFTRPSKVNATAFEGVVDEVAGSIGRLLATLSTGAPARGRLTERPKLAPTSTVLMPEDVLDVAAEA